MRDPVEDTNRCTYRVQLDRLVLEGQVDVSEADFQQARPMTCRVKLHLNGEPGIETDLTRGQLVIILQFFQAIWTQIGGLGKFQPADWKDAR